MSALPENALVRIELEDIRKNRKIPKNGSLFLPFPNIHERLQQDSRTPCGEYPPNFLDFYPDGRAHLKLRFCVSVCILFEEQRGNSNGSKRKSAMER